MGPMSPASSAGRSRGRSFSGTAFVVACALAAVAFVAFLVLVSPVLLARTQAAAPPPAPQQVGAGQQWTATAVEADPDEACLELRGRRAEPARLCTGPRGEAVRAAGVVRAGPARVAYGIVDARTTTVRLDFGPAGSARAAPAYVDFGFPLGFFAVELPAGADLAGVEALDRDGERRGVAGPPYSGGQG